MALQRFGKCAFRTTQLAWIKIFTNVAPQTFFFHTTKQEPTVIFFLPDGE
jgi:hypothetical protein